ncbi:hypothetical protein [Polynucleobacter sp.]|uniref:hypothetical protein n=1 Tax=Polynucleobacter sp. TaxID=2029855 RepID=UPI0037C87DB2
MKIRNILVLLAGALLSLQSFAQASNWPIPNKPITFINPFPPGGAVDAFGRPLAKQLSTQMGTSIIVDNKGGAGGTVRCKNGSRWLYLASWRSAPLDCPKHAHQPVL